MYRLGQHRAVAVGSVKKVRKDCSQRTPYDATRQEERGAPAGTSSVPPYPIAAAQELLAWSIAAGLADPIIRAKLVEYAAPLAKPALLDAARATETVFRIGKLALNPTRHLALRDDQPVAGLTQARWLVIEMILSSPTYQISEADYLERRGILPNPDPVSSSPLKDVIFRLRSVLPRCPAKTSDSTLTTCS